MELVLGKKFKLEVWEVIVQKMSLNEVAKFTVHKSVSKGGNFQELEMVFFQEMQLIQFHCGIPSKGGYSLELASIFSFNWGNITKKYIVIWLVGNFVKDYPVNNFNMNPCCFAFQ